MSTYQQVSEEGKNTNRGQIRDNISFNLAETADSSIQGKIKNVSRHTVYRYLLHMKLRSCGP